MTVELGHYALALALLVALVQAGAGLWGAHARNPHAMAITGPAAVTQAALCVSAFAALANAFLTSDFSVAAVTHNSHSQMPWIYKFAGVWGNHEGSMLLWIMVIAVLGAFVALLDRNLPPTLRARVLGVQGFLAAGFLAFSIFTSNPFARLDPAPIDGQALNPLLQDPGLAFHPPFLYVGFVGFSVAFSFSVAALLEGRVDAAWARWVRPWTLFAWTCLTLGIAMGAGWAYYELGWGGFWFWDPVENSSLMPWLAGTALLHSAIVVEKRDTLKGWTILLAIAAFSTSILGTFVVRSGLLTSVHTFASDPARGVFLLALSFGMTGGALLLYALRAGALQPGGSFRLFSRETLLIVNNIGLAAVLAAVAAGTFWPLAADMFLAQKVSVGAPYFDRTAVPVAIILSLAMSVGTLTPWKRGDFGKVLMRLRTPAIITLLAFIAAFWLAGETKLLAAVGVAMGVWIIAGVKRDFIHRGRFDIRDFGGSWRRALKLPRGMWGGSLAHAGLGVVILGITGTTLFMSEELKVLRPGESLTVSGYTLRLDEVREVQQDNYEAERATITLMKGSERLGRVYPEKRFYPTGGQRTTEAAIRLRPWGDLYVVLGDPSPDGEGRVINAKVHPLVGFIWVGAWIMFIGGLVSLSDRRYRIGAPTPRSAPASAKPATGGP